MSQIRLSYFQKLQALSLRFYHRNTWKPKPGDHYTSCREDLELYRVVKIENGKIFTEYAHQPGILSQWDEDGFTTEGFGVNRVFVPEFILNDNKEEDDLDASDLRW